MNGFIIEMRHKQGGRPVYMCTVPLNDKGTDLENTVVQTIAEAREFSYPTAEAAASMVGTLPKTKNIDYKVIEVPDWGGAR